VDLEMKGLLTIRETARLLGLSPWVAYRLAREGKLPGLVRLGGRRLFVKRKVLEAWLKSDGQEKDVVEVSWP